MPAGGEVLLCNVYFIFTGDPGVPKELCLPLKNWESCERDPALV